MKIYDLNTRISNKRPQIYFGKHKNRNLCAYISIYFSIDTTSCWYENLFNRQTYHKNYYLWFKISNRVENIQSTSIIINLKKLLIRVQLIFYKKIKKINFSTHKIFISSFSYNRKCICKKKEKNVIKFSLYFQLGPTLIRLLYTIIWDYAWDYKWSLFA